MIIFCKYCYCLVDQDNINYKNRFGPHKKYSCCLDKRPALCIEPIARGKKNRMAKGYTLETRKATVATQTTGYEQLIDDDMTTNGLALGSSLLLELSKGRTFSND